MQEVSTSAACFFAAARFFAAAAAIFGATVFFYTPILNPLANYTTRLKRQEVTRFCTLLTIIHNDDCEYR